MQILFCMAVQLNIFFVCSVHTCKGCSPETSFKSFIGSQWNGNWSHLHTRFCLPQYSIKFGRSSDTMRSIQTSLFHLCQSTCCTSSETWFEFSCLPCVCTNCLEFLWEHIRDSQTYSTFKRHLKTHLFQTAFNITHRELLIVPWFSFDYSGTGIKVIYLLTSGGLQIIM